MIELDKLKGIVILLINWYEIVVASSNTASIKIFFIFTYKNWTKICVKLVSHPTEKDTKL